MGGGEGIHLLIPSQSPSVTALPKGEPRRGSYNFHNNSSISNNLESKLSLNQFALFLLAYFLKKIMHNSFFML